MKLDELYEQLHRRNLVEAASAPAMTFAEGAGPWYTRALLGVMGWVGGLLVLGFFGSLIAGLFNSAPGMAVLAAAMFLGSATIYRNFGHSDFATQFALAASICGQAAAVVAFGKMYGADATTPVAWFAAAMQISLVWLMPNFLHRFLSTMFAVLALFVATKNGFASAGVSAAIGLGFVYLVREESSLVLRGRRALAEPVIAGLAIGLLLAGVAHIRLFGSTPWLQFSPQSALAFAASLVLWVALAARGLAAGPRSAALLATIAFCVASWRAPGLAACALVLFVSFARGRRTMTGLSLVALVGYLSTYYYQMEITLALKSAVLAATGGVLLVSWWVHRQYFSEEGV